MTSVNRILIIGYAGGDPKVRNTKNGGKVASFSIATTKRWKDRNSGERKEKTQWHNVVTFFPALVETIENRVKKGTHILIMGEMEYRQYQGTDYVDRIAAEIVLDGFGGRIELIDDMRAPGGGGEASRPGGAPPDPDPDDYGGAPARQRQQPTPAPRTAAPDDDSEVPF